MKLRSTLTRVGVGYRFPGWRILLLALILLPANVVAQLMAREHEMHATILYNLAHFLEWPEPEPGEKEAPFVIGVVGRNPFGTVLSELLEGERIDGRLLVAKQVEEMEGAAECQILFIADSEKQSVERILAEMAGNPVLTVSAMEGFAAAGGGIELFQENQRIRLRINLREVRESGIKVSATLLGSGIAVVMNHYEGAGQ